MNENDLDLEFERRLRGWYHDEFDARVRAPESLRGSVSAIPRTVPVARRRLDSRARAGLLAAAALLVVGGGVLVSGFLAPGPSVFVVTPSRSPEPTASPSLPVSYETPSVSPPVVVVVPSVEPSFVPVPAPPVPATWRAAGSMASGRAAHMATLLGDGRVLVTGGVPGTGDGLPSAEVWDPLTRAFTATGDMHAKRIGHAATRLLDGRVFVVGGDDHDGPTASAEIWDPATGTFGSEIATPDLRGSGLTATLLADGRVLVVGGVKCLPAPPRGTPSCGDELATLIWDPATEIFTPGPRLHDGRDWGTATLLPDGRVIVIGGTGLGVDRPEAAEVWDPATLAFERVDEPRDYRSGALSATVLPDGRVMIAGGDTGDLTRNDAWYGPLGSAEVWDPGTGTFERAGTMATVRSGHQAALLADGQVIVVGGSPERTATYVDNALATTEIWDPSTGSFHDGPSMSVGRRAFTFTRLADGTFLAIGGASRIDPDGVMAVVATAEQLGSFVP